MSPNTKYSVFIAYGFCEGPKIASEFNRTLSANGFNVIKDMSQADIIFTHSGGGFVLPSGLKSKLVVLVGLPYWPGKSLVRAVNQKVMSDFSYHRHDRTAAKWIKKTALNVFYFFNFKNNFAMLNGRGFYLKNLEGHVVALIRNQEDTTTTPEFNKLPQSSISTYISLYGQHDDCWLHPEIYSKLLRELAQQYNFKVDRV